MLLLVLNIGCARARDAHLDRERVERKLERLEHRQAAAVVVVREVARVHGLDPAPLVPDLFRATLYATPRVAPASYHQRMLTRHVLVTV